MEAQNTGVNKNLLPEIGDMRYAGRWFMRNRKSCIGKERKDAEPLIDPIIAISKQIDGRVTIDLLGKTSLTVCAQDARDIAKMLTS